MMYQDWTGMDIDWRDRTRPRVDVGKMSSPVRCTHCQKVYDLGKAEVTARYTDCSITGSWTSTGGRCGVVKLALPMS